MDIIKLIELWKRFEKDLKKVEEYISYEIHSMENDILSIELNTKASIKDMRDIFINKPFEDYIFVNAMNKLDKKSSNWLNQYLIRITFK